MKNESKRRGSGAVEASPTSRRKGKHRQSRPLPQWLTGSTELDTIARRRCLMILSVLSGERAVTEVIEELELSRQMYYLLETKALNAMLAALVPGSDRTTSDAAAAIPSRRIAELEEKVKRLEQSRRRGEHLLFLTRQVLGPGPVKLGKGGRRPSKSKAARPGTSSTSAGRAHSPSSTSSTPKRASARSRTTPTPVTTPAIPSESTTTSIASPTPAGEDAR